MSLFKKIAAVSLGAGSAVGWLAVNAAKAALEAAADKVGNGSVTGKNGQTYTRSDYKDAGTFFPVISAIVPNIFCALPEM